MYVLFVSLLLRRVVYCVSYVYINDILVKRSFLAILTRPRSGTDLCPPLAHPPRLIPRQLHLRLSYKVYSFLCTLVHELKHVGTDPNLNWRQKKINDVFEARDNMYHRTSIFSTSHNNHAPRYITEICEHRPKPKLSNYLLRT